MLQSVQGSTVEQRSLGSLSVSVVGLGCNNFGVRLDHAGTRAVIDAALEVGVNFFDTADIYGGERSEVLVGECLRARRSEVVIATKFGMPLDDVRYGATPEYVKSACTASLTRLNTDYLDLYQLHYPDETVPIEETLGALHELIDAGYVREIGCSNLSVAQLRAAKSAAGAKPAFISVQNQYSLLARDPERDGVLEVCDELDLGFLPFYPLANGLLTGKIRPGEPIPDGTRLATMAPERSAHWRSDELMARVGQLVAYADAIETPLLTLAFSWLLAHHQVRSVIAGASTPAQIQANVAAAVALSTEVVAELNELTR